MSAHGSPTGDHGRPDTPDTPAVDGLELLLEELCAGNPLDSLTRHGHGSTPAPRQTAGQWFSELEEWLPNAFIHSRASELAALRADGASPRLAATYAIAYLHAPILLVAI